MADNFIKTSDIALPEDVSNEILAKTLEGSAIMQLARRITLPGRGVSIPVITGEPTAEWVGETAKKPVSKHTLTKKTMTPYTIAVIEAFSNQFKNSAEALYDALVARLPAALARTFDATVIGAVDAPGDNFDTFADAQMQSILTDPYGGLVDAYTDIANNGGEMNGIAMGPAGRALVMKAVDEVGRPIFMASANDGAPDRLIGVPVFINRGIYLAEDDEEETPAIVGIAGDWTKALFGTVEGVKISISDQATLTYPGPSSTTVTVNLWQQNMFAVRAEIEVGFRADVDAFNLLTGVEPEEDDELGGGSENVGG